MQKVTAICLHENYRKVKNFTVVKANGDSVCLIHYDDIKMAYDYDNFNDLYNSLLIVLKNNGFYVKHWREFAGYFYSINFIDISNPNMPKLFPFRKK